MKTPPEKQQKESPTTKEENTFAKWIAFILDDLIKIPGTKKRIGLDPIIGLIPGVGDFATSTAGLSLLAIGAKKHIPLSVYLRMIANWMLNSLVGALPFIGDIFSFWYKSNHRNHTLLRAHLNDTVGEEAERSGWAPVIILAVVAVTVFTLIGLIAWWAASLIWPS
ncbi:MAG: DUF4112 domain-containing protein [Akkermansiaceae bacterium]